MDGTRQLLILRSRVCVSLANVSYVVVDREMPAFVSALPTPRGTQQIPQYRRDIVGRTLGIDAINRSRDSEQRDLGEVLGNVNRTRRLKYARNDGRRPSSNRSSAWSSPSCAARMRRASTSASGYHPCGYDIQHHATAVARAPTGVATTPVPTSALVPLALPRSCYRPPP